MLNKNICEKIIHTLELKIFGQVGVDSINFTRPFVSPFSISSIQDNDTLGCYNNPEKTCKSYFYLIAKLFPFYKHYHNMPIFLKNKMYAYIISQHSSVTSQYASHINCFRYIACFQWQLKYEHTLFASPSSTVIP
jgi:hypothetical protein